MALLSWSDQYLIGNNVIDTEHKELFRLINDFHTHWLEAQDRRDIARVLNQLITYAQMHFQHEEKIMEAAGYPKLAEHQEIHEALIDSIFQLHHSYSEGNLHLEINTMKFVRNWLIEHILKNDYLFRDFLSRQKSSGEAAS
ncbi:MAG: hemerythrin family protein [Propionivibrio sp.]|uniref:bacteriohemerythrin n=1 Tax=Propionivibrio sp. TaxID=2212460 RepID=UPI001A3A5747|nr:bacteriohemerythrin [Propionivibrio sp.]MBL8416404.1 hemerythrin family protein [Propionivibrio sp.]